MASSSSSSDSNSLNQLRAVATPLKQGRGNSLPAKGKDCQRRAVVDKRSRKAGPASCRDRGRSLSSEEKTVDRAALRRSRRCWNCGSISDLPHVLSTPRIDECWCFACRIKAMDPFNVVVEPGGLLKCHAITKAQHDFVLDVPDLKAWRKLGLAIEARMVRVSCNKMHQVWPRSLQLYANGNSLFEVKPPEDRQKRRDVPHNISAGLKCGRNDMRICLSDEQITDFALGIILTRPRKIQDLRAQVSYCGREAAESRFRTLMCLQESNREIMCLTSSALSLKCPLSLERISQPTRGVKCQHLQCFSFESYAMCNMSMSAFNRRWQCPICSLVVRPSELCIDDFVARILASTPGGVDEVTLAADGSWTYDATQIENIDARGRAAAKRKTGAAANKKRTAPTKPMTLSSSKRWRRGCLKDSSVADVEGLVMSIEIDAI